LLVVLLVSLQSCAATSAPSSSLPPNQSTKSAFLLIFIGFPCAVELRRHKLSFLKLATKSTY
jgi:hypothetical protein